MSEEKPLVRIIDDEETIRNSERFIFKLVGLESVCYESAESFLLNDDFGIPGCIVLDLRMENMTGLELQRELIQRGCDLPIVFLTGHATVDTAVLALKNGACDFLQKPVKPEKLQAIVKELIERNLAAREKIKETENRRKLYGLLTEREKEVIVRISLGKLNKQVAYDLDIAEHTVKIHRGNAMRKLGLHSAVEAHEFLKSIGEIRP